MTKQQCQRLSSLRDSQAVAELGWSVALFGWVRPQGSRCSNSSLQAHRTRAATSHLTLFWERAPPCPVVSLKHRERAWIHMHARLHAAGLRERPNEKPGREAAASKHDTPSAQAVQTNTAAAPFVFGSRCD